MDERASQRSYRFNGRMALLTLFAATGFPLTLVASIFSLPGRYSGFLQQNYWAYLVIAILLVLLSLFSVCYVGFKQKRRERQEGRAMAEFG
jgi:Mg2+ and Co2+ transporter CorA